MTSELNLSVVVPIKNMAGRLGNLSKSLNQALFMGAEVILVLDGCEDDTQNEIESIFDVNQKNLIVVNTKGVGPGGARNEGARFISRSWTVFWDSDDVGDVATIAKILSEVSNQESDLLISRFYSSTSNTLTASSGWKENNIDKNLKSVCISPGIWRMIFRSSFISGITFGDSKLGEDQVFLSRVLERNPRIGFSDYPGYTYFANISDQLTSQMVSKYDLRVSIQEIAQSIENSEYSKYQVIILLKLIWTYFKSLKENQTTEIVKLLKSTHAFRAIRRRFVDFISALTHLVLAFISSKRTNYIHLTGGLGNQLFQLAAIQHLTDNRRICIDVVNGNPRGDGLGNPDSLKYDYESFNMYVSSKALPKLTRKGIGFCLRQNLKMNPRVLCAAITNLAELVTSLLISINLRKIVVLKVSKGIGFDPQIKQSFFNTYFLGYFQSYKWSEHDLEAWSKFAQLKDVNDELQRYISLAEIEAPLVVHVRLGDYLAEDGFGTPGTNYYESAIRYACNEVSHKRIWLFSDDPELAVTRFPTNLPIDIRIMPNFGGSPVIALEAMRLGKGYIIANSTFSWWGAYMSFFRDKHVISPNPWFKKSGTPLELIPNNWKRLESN